MVKKTTKKEVSKKLPKVKKTSSKTSKLTAEQKEEKYWNEVDQLAQKKIYHLLTKNIPFQNIKLITEPWEYEDRQQKLSGLYLHRDVDYRTVLIKTEDRYYDEEKPNKEYLAEEIAVWYCHMVIKALIGNLSGYSGYDPAFFENLTN